MSFKQKVISITGTFSLFLYLTICMVAVKFELADGNIYWQMLPIFLLNLIIPVMFGAKKLSVAFVITILYLILGVVSTGLGCPLWHPGWTIFLLIPVFEVLLKPSKKSEQKKKRDDHYDYEG